MPSEPSGPPAQGSHSTAGQGAWLSPAPQCHRQPLSFKVPECFRPLLGSPAPLQELSYRNMMWQQSALSNAPWDARNWDPRGIHVGVALNLCLSRTLSGENWSAAKWGDGVQGAPAHQTVAPEGLLVWGTSCWIRLFFGTKIILQLAFLSRLPGSYLWTCH